MGNRSPRGPFVAVALALLGLPLFAAPNAAYGQEEAVVAETPEVQDDQMDKFVRVHLEITEVRDDLHQDLAAWHEDARRREVREEADERIEAILEGHGVTAEEFEDFTRLISMDAQWRDAFEDALTRIQQGG